MPPAVAVITLAFDPVIRLGGFAVRLETVAVAVVVLVMLLIAARVARRVPADPTLDQRLAPGERPRREEHLRRDDLLFVVLGAIPGAVIGARLGAVLLHLDFFAADPGAIVDPSTGSLQLSLAVVGAVIGGAVIGGLLDTPTGRWLHVAALPLLVGLGLGKAAGVLGASGMGSPTDLPWALAYAGPGPWATLGPDIPSHPSQVYEGLGALGVLLVVLVLHAAGLFRARDGRAFFVALGLWAAVRFVVAFTWRDSTVVGPMRADQLLSLLVLAFSVLGFVVAPRFLRRYVRQEEVQAAEGAPAWPDPATRPPF
jgi:phosphatidylglycerol:prolipoprotein diacylglycerol transferase